MGELVIKKSKSITNMENQLDKAIKKAESMKCSNDVEAANASDSIRLLKRLCKQMKDQRIEDARPYDKAKKAYYATVDVLIGKANKAEKIIKDIYEPYLIDKQEQERIDEELRRKKEEDRIKKEAEETKSQMMEVAAEYDEEDLVDQALAIEEVAEIKIDKMNSKKFKVSNVKSSMRVVGITTTWHAEVTDPAAALRWIADKERFEMVEFKGLAAFARGIKKEGEGNGIKIYSKKEVR